MKIAKHNANIGHLLHILISSMLIWGFLGIDHQEIHAQAPPPDERILPLPPVKDPTGASALATHFMRKVSSKAPIKPVRDGIASTFAGVRSKERPASFSSAAMTRL